MKQNKSFTLIEMIVSLTIIILLAVAFTPNLARQQQQAELDKAIQQIQNAVYEARSLAISPNMVNNVNGKAINNYILILNITREVQTYCQHVIDGDWSCPSYGGITDGTRIPGNSYRIFGVEDVNPMYRRKEYKTVSYDSNISIYYDYPCHNTSVQPECGSGVGGESFFWKPHFRNSDGYIGFDARYFDNPDWAGGNHTSYWIENMWGCGTSDCRPTSRLVFVWGDIGDTKQITDTSRCNTTTHRYTDPSSGYQSYCKILQIDNVTGVMQVL